MTSLNGVADLREATPAAMKGRDDPSPADVICLTHSKVLIFKVSAGLLLFPICLFWHEYVCSSVSYPNSSSSGFQLFLQFGSHQGLANQHCPAWSWNYVCCQVNLFLFIKLAYADLFVSSWSMILLSTNKLIRIWVGCWVELISIMMWRKVLFHETLYLILLITELKCLNMICLYFVVVEYYFDCNCDTFIEELSNLN